MPWLSQARSTFAQPIFDAMRHFTLFVFSFFLYTTINAQVFMRPFENAAAMGMGGATIAIPSL
jgi:hypothetical protein